MARGRKIEKSFYDWCIENKRRDILYLWDYELNQCSPKEVGYKTDKKYYFKCPRGIHNSELKILGNITINSLKCNKCNSFGQWLIDTFGEDALEKYWDYRMNKVNPLRIAKCSNKKVWIICQEKDYHGSYEITCNNFYNGRRCSYCRGLIVHPKDSFGQMLMDEYGSLEVIWDFEKNGDLDPFGLAKVSSKKVWLFCQEKEYHGSYEIRCANYYKDRRCPYCCNHHGKVHPLDSFGQKLIDDYGEDAIERYWSKKNTINPFSIAPYSTKKYWFICQNDEEHEDYETTARNFSQGNRCPKCKESHGERRIRECLNTHNINFIAQKEFSDLVGISEWKPLSYDFYIPEQNLLIEYQGGFHDGTARYSNETQEEYEERFKRQQEHDRRKREYAESHNIRLLEIWYWDFDNIEIILNKNIK